MTLIVMFMFMFIVMVIVSHVYNHDHVHDHVQYIILLSIQVGYLIPVETSESSNSRSKGFSVARGQGDPWSMVYGGPGQKYGEYSVVPL
jgi:hypothetical protein